MAKRILNAITNNFIFKILAVALAFALWLVVYNIDDPSKTRTYTASVVLENIDNSLLKDKYFEVLDNTDIVSFTVTAKRTVIEKLEDSDFVATADMSRMNISEDGSTASVPIEISCSSSRYSNSVKFGNRDKYVEISLEELLNKQFVVTANEKGTPKAGYALGDVTVNSPNVLKISGPKDIVSQISAVVATIDVEGMDTDITDNVIPTLYDADGKEITKEKLTLSNQTVSISASILSTKEVPIKLSTTGTPAGGNTVTEITANPSTVKLKGSAANLNSVTEITVPANALNVSGLQSDLSTTIDISDYIPGGVSLVNKKDSIITVKVSIQQNTKQTFSVSTSNLTLSGLAEGYEAKISGDSVDVSVSGSSTDVSELSAENIHGIVDVEGLSEGTHEVNISWNLSNKYTTGTSTVKVVITKKSTTNNNNEPDDGEGE